MSYELRAAIRGILLPVASSREEEFLQAVSDGLDGLGIPEDKASWIDLQLRRWKRDGAPTAAFRDLVRGLLFTEGRDPVTFMFDSIDGPNGAKYLDASRKASREFFALHSKLMFSHLLDHDSARHLVSHSGMIVRLAVEEQMTASEICRVLSVKDNRLSLNWRPFQTVLSSFGCKPTLSVDQVADAFQRDIEAEPELLGDLSIEGSIDRVAEIARNLGCGEEFSVRLRDLLIHDLHAPYLPLLHYQLLIQYYFDHAVTYAYEFQPRGMNGQWMTDRYIEAGIPVARSAVLNNAKATLRFDHVWVYGRDGHLRSATALADILEAVENMSAVAKDEIAAQLRGLLHRYIRVQSEINAGGLPNEIPPLTHAAANLLLAHVGAENTNTTGILEQRLVDCFGLIENSAAGWSPKGLGDSVFAANTFRKKLGDVEFELPERPNPQSVSYESHGGNLTAPYVHDHLDSFEFVLGVRRDELETIAPLADWRFEVVFVAHRFDEGLPANAAPLGANVTIRYVTFEDAADMLRNPAHLALLNKYMIDPLNSGFVHPRVRQRALVLMA